MGPGIDNLISSAVLSNAEKRLGKYCCRDESTMSCAAGRIEAQKTVMTDPNFQKARQP